MSRSLFLSHCAAQQSVRQVRHVLSVRNAELWWVVCSTGIVAASSPRAMRAACWRRDPETGPKTDLETGPETGPETDLEALVRLISRARALPSRTP